MAKAPPIIRLEPSKEDIDRITQLFVFEPKKIRRVLYRSINRVMTTERAKIARVVNKSLKIKVSLVKARLWFKKATTKELWARIKGGSKGFPYRAPFYDTEQKAAGAKVKRGPVKHIPRGFIASMGRTTTTVKGNIYTRKSFVGKAHPRLQKPHKGKPLKKTKRMKGRFPIIAQHTPSLSEIVGEAGLYSTGQEELAAKLSERIAYETQREMAKGAK